MTKQKILDLYFMDARFKLTEIAAFREALKALDGGDPERAKNVLLSFSDPTTEPIPAATTKAACGANPVATVS